MAVAQLPLQGTVRAGPTSVEGLVCRSVGSEWAWRGGLRGELGCVQVIAAVTTILLQALLGWRVSSQGLVVHGMLKHICQRGCAPVTPPANSSFHKVLRI